MSSYWPLILRLMLHLFIKTFCELGIRKGHDLEEQFYVVKVKIEIF